MVSSLVPNAHISEVILTLASGMDASSDNIRTELCSHASMVVLGSNYFVIESTGRNFNVQPFSSDIGMGKTLFLLMDL